MKSNVVQFILDIIDRISYSRENKCIIEKIHLDWSSTIGEIGIFIRDIVSDADKLEAIGKIGVIRCLEYSRHKNPEFSEREHFDVLVEHSREKLLILYTEFMRTSKGRELAEPRHQEIIDEINKMKKCIMNE